MRKCSDLKYLVQNIEQNARKYNIAQPFHCIESDCSIKKNRQKALLNKKFIQISIYLRVKSEQVLFSCKLTCKKQRQIIDSGLVSELL